MNSPVIESHADMPTLADRREVAVSRWVNEPLPDWNQMLTAHDVARLTRRPPWLLSSLALLKRFPKERTFRGRKVGWHRSDVLGWLTQRLATAESTGPEHQPHRRRRDQDNPSQQCLPLSCRFSFVSVYVKKSPCCYVEIMATRHRRT